MQVAEEIYNTWDYINTTVSPNIVKVCDVHFVRYLSWFAKSQLFLFLKLSKWFCEDKITARNGETRSRGSMKTYQLRQTCAIHLEFNWVFWEVLVGHEGRMLAAPLEQRREPGLVLRPAWVHLLVMEERGGGKWSISYSKTQHSSI